MKTLMKSTTARRKSSLHVAMALVVALVAFVPAAQAVIIPTVPVGNAGNAADTEVMTTDGTTGYGSVGYDYRIGTTEVSNAQYTAFLNAKAASDPFALYSTGMANNHSVGVLGMAIPGGITRSGSSGSFTYATIAGRGNKPVNYVNWYDSIRFANWLNNGQGNGDTETGAYTLLGGTPTPSNGLSITRNAGATWFLASEDEWYKAAYYDPSDSSYFDFPTSSDTAPISEAPPGGSNSGNFNNFGGFTDVGAYTASDSPYGTFDQGGNVWEWTETLFDGSSRAVRGDSFFGNVGSANLRSSIRGTGDPTNAFLGINGFRVATVPEPSTAVLAIVACGILLWWRRLK